MKYRVIAALVMLAILAVGIFLNNDHQPAPTSPGAPATQPSREDDAMKNLKL